MDTAEAIRDLFSENRSGTRYIFCPFIQSEALEALLEGVPHGDLVVVTRWNASDLATGVSDPTAYEVVTEKGGTMYVHPDIHLKAYLWNKRVGYVGSANVTQKGLGLTKNANYELMIGPVVLTPSQRLKLEKLVDESVHVSEELYSRAVAYSSDHQVSPLPDDLADFSLEGASSSRHYVSELPMTDSALDLIETIVDWEEGSVEDLPETTQDCVMHDITKYRLMSAVGEDREEVKIALRKEFLSHPFIERMVGAMDPCLHFGEAKAWIQENCEDVPVPSRRDLTGKVQVLFRWFVEIDPDRFEVDVPGEFSERICDTAEM